MTQFIIKNVDCIYCKYELQLRTLLHEAWSEVQHGVIYKPGESAEDNFATATRFSELAEQLNYADNKLSRLAKSQVLFARTHDQKKVRVDAMEQSILDKISDYDTNEIAMKDRFNYARNFYNENKGIIDKTTKEVTEENIEFALNLAELFLKSGHYEEAYALYIRAITITSKDGWIYLRLIENMQ